MNDIEKFHEGEIKGEGESFKNKPVCLLAEIPSLLRWKIAVHYEVQISMQRFPNTSLTFFNTANAWLKLRIVHKTFANYS